MTQPANANANNMTTYRIQKRTGRVIESPQVSTKSYDGRSETFYSTLKNDAQTSFLGGSWSKVRRLNGGDLGISLSYPVFTPYANSTSAFVGALTASSKLSTISSILRANFSPSVGVKAFMFERAFPHKIVGTNYWGENDLPDSWLTDGDKNQNRINVFESENNEIRLVSDFLFSHCFVESPLNPSYCVEYAKVTHRNILGYNNKYDIEVELWSSGGEGKNQPEFIVVTLLDTRSPRPWINLHDR